MKWWPLSLAKLLERTMSKEIVLFRRFNADGSAWKDWAYSKSDGQFVVYFGKTGTKMQSRIIGPAIDSDILKRVGDQEKEGYVAQGTTTLSDNNFVIEPQAPKAKSSELYVFQTDDHDVAKALYMQHAKELQAPPDTNEYVVVVLTQSSKVLVTVMAGASLEHQLFVFGWVAKCLGKGLPVKALFSEDLVIFENKLQVVKHLEKRHTGASLGQLLIHYQIKEESVTEKIRNAASSQLVF
jgi:hypothetical protein